MLALRSRLIITFPSTNNRCRESSKISHKNLITGYMFLKLVTGFRTYNQLTSSHLTSLIIVNYIWTVRSFCDFFLFFFVFIVLFFRVPWYDPHNN